MKTFDPPKLKLDPKQKARHPADAIRQLAASIRQVGLLQHPGVLPDGRVIWGHGRILAWMEAKPGEPIPCVVLEKPMTEADYLVLIPKSPNSRLHIPSGAPRPG